MMDFVCEDVRDLDSISKRKVHVPHNWMRGVSDADAGWLFVTGAGCVLSLGVQTLSISLITRWRQGVSIHTRNDSGAPLTL